MTGNHRGMLVSVDGLAGAGKSTTAKSLRSYLAARGYSVHATTEPSRATLGEIARHNTETYRGLTLACLVAADRYHHLDTELRPKRDAGHIVVCDRYVASSYVLQRMDGVPLEFVHALNVYADKPDLAVILTVDPDVAAARVAVRGAHDRFHTGAETSAREADLYRDAAELLEASGYPVFTIDTTRTPPDRVVAYIGTRIAQLLRGPNSAPAPA
jgi:dTMP kinase